VEWGLSAGISAGFGVVHALLEPLQCVDRVISYAFLEGDRRNLPGVEAALLCTRPLPGPCRELRKGDLLGLPASRPDERGQELRADRPRGSAKDEPCQEFIPRTAPRREPGPLVLLAEDALKGFRLPFQPIPPQVASFRVQSAEVFAEHVEVGEVLAVSLPL